MHIISSARSSSYCSLGSVFWFLVAVASRDILHLVVSGAHYGKDVDTVDCRRNATVQEMAGRALHFVDGHLTRVRDLVLCRRPRISDPWRSEPVLLISRPAQTWGENDALFYKHRFCLHWHIVWLPVTIWRNHLVPKLETKVGWKLLPC